jgi:hypothetical protein
VGVLASRLPGWFHDSAATPRFFSLFRNFTFLVFGRGKKRLAIDDTEAHHDKYDKYANTLKSVG